MMIAVCGEKTEVCGGMWGCAESASISFKRISRTPKEPQLSSCLWNLTQSPPTSTSTHFSSNSLKLYFLRPDRLFRDPGVIIKELLVKATQLLWLGQETAISLVFSHKKCIVNIFHAMFMLHICHSFDSSMLSLPLHSAMPRICLQHRIWLQM